RGTTGAAGDAPILVGAGLGAPLGGALDGIVAGVLTASLLFAYVLVGLAVLHAVTRGINGRGFVLAGIYATVVVFQLRPWPVLLLALLGLADHAFDFRRRAANRRGLPPTTTLSRSFLPY